jgi:hypothetical protein
MPPSKVSSSNIYSVWRKVNSLRAKIFSFRVVNVISRMPQPVYELSDLEDRGNEGQFYNYELVKVTVLPETEC